MMDVIGEEELLGDFIEWLESHGFAPQTAKEQAAQLVYFLGKVEPSDTTANTVASLQAEEVAAGGQAGSSSGTTARAASALPEVPLVPDPVRGMPLIVSQRNGKVRRLHLIGHCGLWPGAALRDFETYAEMPAANLFNIRCKRCFPAGAAVSSSSSSESSSSS